jgi:hypothetical protein
MTEVINAYQINGEYSFDFKGDLDVEPVGGFGKYHGVIYEYDDCKVIGYSRDEHGLEESQLLVGINLDKKSIDFFPGRNFKNPALFFLRLPSKKDLERGLSPSVFLLNLNDASRVGNYCISYLGCWAPYDLEGGDGLKFPGLFERMEDCLETNEIIVSLEEESIPETMSCLEGLCIGKLGKNYFNSCEVESIVKFARTFNCRARLDVIIDRNI